MCKSKKSTKIVQSQTSKSHKSKPSSSTSSSLNYPSFNFASSSASSSSAIIHSSNTTDHHFKNNSKSSSSSSSSFSRPSLKTLKASLPDNPNLYHFTELCKATNNFLSKPFSSSSSSTSWRCRIRHKDVILFQRKLRRRNPIDPPELHRKLSVICRSHHSSLIKLLGASTSGSYVYLVYEYINGANLSTCLRNPKNPNYTILSNWVSRMQIATDLAHGLEYIHHCTDKNAGIVHNHLKSSSIVVSEDSLNAKICHFGTAELCGETEKPETKSLTRSNSKGMKIEGTRGYMSPEFQATGEATQKSDVYAFGVVILELVSGEEALRYVFDEGSGGFRRVSVIDGAEKAVARGVGGVRSWVDKRLRDSYPVTAAEKMVVLGLECVAEQPEKRPDMEQIAVRVSKLYLESKDWAEKFGMPVDFSVSLAPR